MPQRQSRQSFDRNNSPLNGRVEDTTMSINKEEKVKHVGGLMFILKKSEKLTTALYMVTDIMPEREPMKWKMREASVDLLSDTTLALDATMGARIAVLGAAIRKIEKVVSFLDIAQASRMVSEMNASVLKKEYISLKSVIEGEWEKLFDRSKSIFTDSFFDVPTDHESSFPQIEDLAIEETSSVDQMPPRYVATPLDERQAETDRIKRSAEARVDTRVDTSTEARKDFSRTPGASLDTSIKSEVRPNVRLGGNTPHAEKHPLPVKVHADPMTPIGQIGQSRLSITQKTETRPEEQAEEQAAEQARRLPHQSNQIVERREAQMIVMPGRNTDLLVRRSESEVGKSDRRTIILALIKQKPQLAVKDISKSIPDVSEKTIQRELLAMVAEGMLVKKGERRWSTYSLRS